MKKGCAKLLVCLLAVSAFFISTVGALSERKDVDVEFVVNPSLTLELSSDDVFIDNLIPGTADISNEITVSVSTNSESGYVLNAVAGDITNNTTNLVHEDAGTTDTFVSIASGTPVQSITESSTWGYSIDHGSTFSGMPLFTDTEHVEQINATTEPAIDDIPFLISARAAKFQAPGEYRNVVTFTATANPVPDTIETVRYMQDINDDVYASMEMEKQYQLIDKRDNKKYWISKLADGNVWMTQNLDYRLTAPSITLYPETSNVTAITTIKIAENRPNQISYENGTKNEGLLVSNVNPDTYIPGGDFVDDNGVFISHAALVSTESLASDDENWHYQVGARYPTKSSYYNSNQITTSVDAWYDGESIAVFSGGNIGVLESFCPKGWRLPESVSMDSVDVAAQYSVDALSKYYPQISQPPVYLTGEIGEDYNGVGSNVSGVLVEHYLITKNSIDNYVGVSYFDSKISNWSYWYDGSMDSFAPIRCVASRSTEYPFRYFANDGTGRIIYSYTPASWGGADASIKAINNTVRLYNADNYQEQEHEVTRLNYDFVGWSTDPDATAPDYLPGDTVITNMSTTNDLYAVWQPTTKTTIEDAFAAAGKTKVDGEHYAMQDMTVSICIAADNGTGASLVDIRDGNIYTVMKMRRTKGSDGLCWMVDNLRLGGTDQDYVLTSDDTDTVDEFTLPARSTYELSASTAQMYIDDTVDEAIGKYYGNRYNRYAVTAGTNNLNGNSSICPKGWTIPQAYTNSKGYAMTMLYYRGNGGSYGAVTNDILRQLHDPVAFSYTGAFNGSAFDDRTVGYYWTQQYDGGYYIYNPAIDQTLYSSSFNYTDPSAVETGFAALRCVIKTTL